MNTLFQKTIDQTNEVLNQLNSVDQNTLASDPSTTDAIAAVSYGNSYLCQALAAIEESVVRKSELTAGQGTPAEPIPDPVPEPTNDLPLPG